MGHNQIAPSRPEPTAALDKSTGGRPRASWPHRAVWPRWRTLMAVGLAAALAACNRGSISRDAAFDPGRTPVAGGAGLVVVGLRVLREPVETTILGDFSTHSVYELHFRQVTDEGYFGQTYREIHICDQVRALFRGILSNCQPGKLQYQVLSVPPGRYTLEWIDYRMSNSRIVTTFNDGGDSGLFSKRRVQNPDRSFTVNDGSVVYIGDLNFFFGPDRAAARMALGRHDDLAAQALATYPNVKGNLVFSPATGNAPGDRVPGELMPIEGSL